MRLIDAEALIRRAIERYKKEMGTDIGHGMGVIASMITDAPTIDAVPVVRCKDCKYGWTHIYQTSAPALHCIKAFGGKEVDPMDFCSSGERKESEG